MTSSLFSNRGRLCVKARNGMIFIFNRTSIKIQEKKPCYNYLHSVIKKEHTKCLNTSGYQLQGHTHLSFNRLPEAP